MSNREIEKRLKSARNKIAGIRRFDLTLEPSQEYASTEMTEFTKYSGVLFFHRDGMIEGLISPEFTYAVNDEKTSIGYLEIEFPNEKNKNNTIMVKHSSGINSSKQVFGITSNKPLHLSDSFEFLEGNWYFISSDNINEAALNAMKLEATIRDKVTANYFLSNMFDPLRLQKLLEGRALEKIGKITQMNLDRKPKYSEDLNNNLLLNYLDSIERLRPKEFGLITAYGEEIVTDKEKKR